MRLAMDETSGIPLGHVGGETSTFGNILVAYGNTYEGRWERVGTGMLDDVVCMEETKITVRQYRHRTTVPAKIFRLLNLEDGDTLRWIAMKDGRIFIEKKTER